METSEELSAGDTGSAPASVAQTGTTAAPVGRCVRGAGSDPFAHEAVEQSAPLPTRRDGQIAVSALVSAYMAAYVGRDTTRVQRLAWWCARLGDLPMADVTDEEIFEALEDLADQRGRHYVGKDADGRSIMKPKSKPLAPATLNRYQAALSAVFTWAQRKRITPKAWSNPCRHLELKPERNAIVRFLDDDERTRLLAACRQSAWPRLYLLVLMALTTGARRGELAAMRWSDVDIGRAEASVHRSKNGDKKVLPLTPVVLEELQRFKGVPSALLFPSKRRPDVAYNFDPAWDRALSAAAVKSFRFHDLRHSCASYLAQAGAPLLEIAEVLGHRQLSVTRRYAHLTTKHKAALVARVLGDIR